jgi:hypothetical protein
MASSVTNFMFCVVPIVNKGFFPKKIVCHVLKCFYSLKWSRHSKEGITWTNSVIGYTFGDLIYKISVYQSNNDLQY